MKHVPRRDELTEFHARKNARNSSPAAHGFTETKGGRWIDSQSGRSLTSQEAWELIDSRKEKRADSGASL